MIRFENHFPEVYVNQSRDFQIFVAVFDYFQNALKFRIDCMESICDTQMIQDYLLPILQTKLGFFTTQDIPLDSLRVILKSFVEIVRNKGSKIGILTAVNTFLNSQNELARAEVTIDSSTHTVDIATTISLKNRYILEAILQYVIPAGYDVSYSLLYSTSIQWKQGIHDDVAYSYWTQRRENSTPSSGSPVFVSASTVVDPDNSTDRWVDTTFIANDDI